MTAIQVQKLDSFLDKTMQSIPIPSLSVYVTRNSKVAYSKQYGKDISVNSSFVLGSVSKSFTALGIQKLLHKHQIDVFTPASTFIALKDTISILDLLNHTSGIASGEKINDLSYKGTYGVFEYSNVNYNLLGKIIEVVSGVSYEEYIDAEIFTLLEMQQSFALSHSSSQNLVKGYKSYFGVPLPTKTEIPDSSTWIQAPSGHLCSSSKDLAKYLQHILSISTGSDSLLKFVMNHGVNVCDNPATDDIFDSSAVYGFGWICKNVNGIDILYHTGKTSCFSSVAVLVPEYNLSLSVLCNMGDFLVGTQLLDKVYEEIISIILNFNHASQTFSKTHYVIPHLIINSLLAFSIVLSVVLSLLIPVEKMATLSIFPILCFILIHFCLPLIGGKLIKSTGIPSSAIKDFAPDVMLVMIICAGVLVGTGFWKVGKLLILFAGT